MMPFPLGWRTERGFHYVTWSLVLNILGLVLFLSAGLALTVSMAGGGAQDTGHFGSSFVPFIGSVLLICGGGAIFVISVILFFMGFYHAYGGKEEYGEGHRRNLVRALILLVIYIVIAVSGFIAGSLVAPPMTSPSAADLQNAAIVGLPFSVVSTVVLGLMFLFLIKELATRLLTKVVWAAVVVSLMGVGAQSVLEIVVLPETLARVGTTPFGISFGLLGASLLTSSVQVLAGILFLLAVLETRRRVREGEVKPVPAHAVPGTAYIASTSQPVLPSPGIRSPASRAIAAVTPPPDGWRYCPRCGTEVAGHSFCPLCGLRTKGPPSGSSKPPGDFGQAAGPEEE